MTRIYQIIAAGGLLAVTAPAGSVRHVPSPPEVQRVAVVAAPSEPVPGFVLVGMAVAGFAIVGASARRRQPGRSVSS